MTIKTLSYENTTGKCKELAVLIDQHTNGKGEGAHATAIKSLLFTRACGPFAIHAVNEPHLAIVVQGKKEALLNEEIYRYSVGQYLLLAVALPLSGCVIEATPEQPFLGFKLKLDPTQLGEIIAQINLGVGKNESVQGWCVSNANPSLIDCALRLTKLLETPQDISFLSPIIIHEIYYRLLTGEQGEAVRQIITSGSNMQRIAEVIRQIKAEFMKPMRVEALAEQANMSAASFHRHFKAVTSMSPLQYQKQLRLLAARQMMLVENVDATSAAYQVGYESTSQFSREYARLFGAPPMRDIERLRTA
ncbi:MAG: AraC family transcriptional regulator N-terminal domain-containing protein [Chroococcidiopsis sp.]